MNTSLATPESPVLRKARPSDVAQLAHIETESFSDPWPESAFADIMHMPAARATVVVDENDVPLGYCVMITAADQGEIANLAVSKQAQRKGIGARLLSDALSFARQQLVVSVYLEVRETNSSARALYMSQGFQEIGRRRGYYQRPLEDALVLQWSGTP